MALQEDINEKLMRALPNEITNKRLSTLQEVSRLPRFISEYAIKEISGENPTSSDLARLSDFVKEYYPKPKERDRILHELMTKSEYTLLW